MARGEEWEVLWCSEGFQEARDRLRKRLPDWCRFRLADPRQPLEAQVSNAAVLVPAAARITRDVIESAKNLRVIIQPAAGYELIDIDECGARNIPVRVGRGVSAQSVAEATLCAMMIMAKRIHAQMQDFQNSISGATVGIQLAGKRLGIIGMGTIGRALANIATGLSMKVTSTSSGSTRADLEHLLRASDFISINCPLSASTRGLIGHTELSLIKPGAYIVNFARAPIIDREALIDKLEEGELSGVALDVHWDEVGLFAGQKLCVD